MFISFFMLGLQQLAFGTDPALVATNDQLPIKRIPNPFQDFDAERLSDGEMKALAVFSMVLGPAYLRSIVPVALADIHKYPPDARRLAQTIKLWGDLATPLLVKHLHSPDPKVRLRVIWLLGEMKARRSLDELIRLRKDKDKLIRDSVIYALAEIQDRRAILPLLDMAWNDPSEALRGNACYAIATFKSGSVEASKSLQQLVLVRAATAVRPQIPRRPLDFFRTEDPCHAEFFALLWIGPSTTPFLETILKDPKYQALHKSIFSAMLCGYPDVHVLRSPGRKNGKNALLGRNDLLKLARVYVGQPIAGQPIDDPASEEAKSVVRDLEETSLKKVP